MILLGQDHSVSATTKTRHLSYDYKNNKNISIISAGPKGRYPLRKISIELNFFPPCIIRTTPEQKKLKILQLFIIRIADHKFKLEQKIGTESPCAGSIFFRSDLMLIFLSGISLKCSLIRSWTNISQTFLTVPTSLLTFRFLLKLPSRQ